MAKPTETAAEESGPRGEVARGASVAASVAGEIPVAGEGAPGGGAATSGTTGEGEGVVDVIVIGGGINGSGIARDAVGRGLSTVLLEKDDIGEGTSSRSGKYIHGGLRYLEYYEFRLVREALIEREVVLGLVPHLAWPLRLILPHSPAQRPRWLIRLGLFLYDHLGGRRKLPATQAVDLRTAPEGEPVDDAFSHAFAYHDVWVDDARLTLLNALDAAERGAEVLPRTRFESAERVDDGAGGPWRVTWRDTLTDERTTRHARALINTAGPWVEQVIGSVAGTSSTKHVRLVKGSHVITQRWWQGAHGYVLQHTDKRLIFVNPLFEDLALIGTTDIPYEGRSEDVAIEDEEIDYLLGILNRCFTTTLTRDDVIDTYSGVRPLFDDDSRKGASAVTRDYTFEIDTGPQGRAVGGAPLLSAFGGKLTTYRKLAEHGLEKLRDHFPEMGGAWTGGEPLPGGDMPEGDFERWFAAFGERHEWLPEALARHYARCYGTRADALLEGARSLEDLGRRFGDRLYEREARWLIEREWALTAEDILWRRTKHRLFMSEVEREAFGAWLEGLNIGAASRRAADAERAGS